MKRLLFLLMVVLAVGVMAGLVNAQLVLDIRVSAGNDDAEEHTDAGEDGRMENWSSSDLELGREDAYPDQQLCGMRFNNIPIPNGAVISNAYLEFTVDELDSGQMSLTVFGALTPDVPNPFDNTLYELSSLPRTSAEVYWIDVPDWTNVNDTYQTPDISSVIAEIVGQAGWDAGNSLVLLVEAYDGSTGDRTAEAYDGEPDSAPRLYVEYIPLEARSPTPEDGGWALTDLPLLQWEMPDPLVEGDTLTVDVVFGTDPNLIVGLYGTVQAETDAAVVNTGNFGRPLTLNEVYYWRVDVIDPNGGNGDVIITGNTWTFTTTVPPAVMITESDDSTEVSEEGETSDTYTISLSKSPPSPVTVTIGPSPVFAPISSGDNDVEERQSDPADGEMDRGSTDLELGNDGNDEQIVGLRFVDIQIPQGATITSATVEFKSDSDEAEDVWLTIWGRLDDPGAFTSAVWTLSTPGIDDETDATVEWTIVDPADDWLDDQPYHTPDISSIIQEIVNQSSWDAGRALVIAIGNSNSLGTTPLGNQRRATSFNEDSYGGTGIAQPILHVEYTIDQITWVPPVVVLDNTNWELGVDVTVTAVDDSLVEADPHTVTLENVVTSADAAWNGLPADDVVVSITENDCGSWGFAPLDLNDDCVVDIGDLAVFAADFGKCTEPFELNCNNLSN